MSVVKPDGVENLKMLTSTSLLHENSPGADGAAAALRFELVDFSRQRADPFGRNSFQTVVSTLALRHAVEKRPPLAPMPPKPSRKMGGKRRAIG